MRHGDAVRVEYWGAIQEVSMPPGKGTWCGVVVRAGDGRSGVGVWSRGGAGLVSKHGARTWATFTAWCIYRQGRVTSRS